MIRHFIWLWWMTLLLAGCAAPEISLDREAERLNLTRSLVKGTDFQHVVYFNQAQSQNGELHIYLDGDGTPWIRRHFVSGNPTPRNPLVLRLMALDPTPSVYLGRPCYHGFSAITPCTSALWTSDRYSKIVIDTMTVALREIDNILQPQKKVLIGYSGGGALAMLMAERVDGLNGVVTIAGNLDSEDWVRRHHYSPLTGSQNPAKRPPLPGKIFQLHIAGEKDSNVPPDLIRSAAQRQPSARLIMIPDADHDCCWEKQWPALLETIKSYVQ